MAMLLPSPDYFMSSFGDEAFFGGAILVILLIILFFVLIFALVTYIFQGIGIMKMHEKLGLKGGWMAFVPFLNSYAFGKVAEQYIKQDGKKSTRFSVIILVGNIINMGFAFCSGFLSGISGTSASLGLSSEVLGVIALFSLALSLIQLTFSVVFSVVVYIALWRIFSIFNNQSATLFLILSLFIGLVQPFLIFAIRNNEPCCVETKEEIPVEVV